MSNLIEVLSPAGSFDSLEAAVRAGADAIYLGGSSFGARAFAGNFDEEELLRAIDYAHLHKKRIFLTINTLFKERDFDELYDYLLPYYKEGLDAVIVQDVGVAAFVREAFPQMDLHASTQMTAMGVESARFLEELGFDRIVPARELSLGEIADIKRETNLEIETFVHGALCFSYSGQCLMSSMLGGRSGNRGRCAQPCRLPYGLYENGQRIGKKAEQYLLSPKDLCSLEILPDILRAGTNSLKIEGRMKRPQYVAAVTRQYRRYVDLFLENPDKFTVRPEDVQELMELYNRGGFTKGYYLTHNGRDMMSMKRPNHMGYYVGKIETIKKNQIGFVAETEIHKKDILEISLGQDDKVELTSPVDGKKGSKIILNANKLRRLRVGMPIYRTRNENLINSIQKETINIEKKEILKGNIRFQVGKSAMIQLAFGDILVEVAGEEVLKAKSAPITREKLLSKLLKTGNTPFDIEIEDVVMDQDAFLPMGAINQLRRDALDAMERAIVAASFREEASRPAKAGSIKAPQWMPARNSAETIAFATTLAQARAALESPKVRAIYLQAESVAFDRWDQVTKECHEAGKEIYYSLPLVFHREARADYVAQKELLCNGGQDGLLIHTLDEYAMLHHMNYEKKLVLDSSLYVYHRSSLDFYKEHMKAPVRVILPVELNDLELSALRIKDADMVVYGRQPLMISAQCQVKNHLGCKHTMKELTIRDRRDVDFPVRNFCKYCYNVIYNGACLQLLDFEEELDQLARGRIYRFTIETEDEVRAILSGRLPNQKYTKGHFKRGIE